MKEYPSDELLKQIEEFPCEDFHAFMAFIYPHWEFSDWGWLQDGDIYYISTGGWSGNEYLIDAMNHNTMFWMLYWQQSKRGGHYIFAPLSAMLKINDVERNMHWMRRLWILLNRVWRHAQDQRKNEEFIACNCGNESQDIKDIPQ